MSHFYGATSLTGGGDGALDVVEVTAELPLQDGDGAIVITSSLGYCYHLDVAHGGLESPPDVITPDFNAEDKRWVLTKVFTVGFESRCSVHLSSNQSISPNTWTKVLFVNKDYDNGNEFISNRFTAKATGFYHVDVQLRMLLAFEKPFLCSIRKNGSEIVQSSAASLGVTNTADAGFGRDVYLELDDYLEIWTYQYDSIDRNIEAVGATYFNIHKFA